MQKLLWLVTKNTNEMVAALWVDDVNSIYTLMRTGWTEAENIDHRIAHGLAQRWPMLSGSRCIDGEMFSAAS